MGFAVSNISLGLDHSEALAYANASLSLAGANGTFDFTVCYATWHSTKPSAEGGLALYVVPPGTDPSSLYTPDASTLQAYGGIGAVRQETVPFRDRYNVDGILDWDCPTCVEGDPERTATPSSSLPTWDLFGGPPTTTPPIADS